MEFLSQAEEGKNGKWQMETNQSIRGSGHTNLSKIAPDIQRNNHKTEEWLRNL